MALEFILADALKEKNKEKLMISGKFSNRMHVKYALTCFSQ